MPDIRRLGAAATRVVISALCYAGVSSERTRIVRLLERSTGGKVTKEIPEKVLHELITKVVFIQKKYAHELSGVRNERRSEIKTALSQLVAEKLEE